jgi:phage baseplate assembly protein V
MSGLQRVISPMARRMRLMVGRCLLAAVNDSLQRQNVQVRLLSGEVADDVEHYQPGGFTSVPLPGAVGLFMSSGGKRSGLAALLLENKEKRLNNLKPGEVAIYNIADSKGHHLILKEGGIATLVCSQFVVQAAADVSFETPMATFSGNVKISGELEVEGVSKAKDHLSGEISGKDHLHTGNLGAPTSPPVGGA